ncbi:MAG: hypothetical protein CR989_01365 [Flavobacteriales bacterium]|nr:MAG: hypothetical protein CR989_01365 [Flavobacteriales bacterium]
MELIYRNDYGAFYSIHNPPNPNCKLQMVVDTNGIFLSERDMAYLLKIVRDAHKPCNCKECKGKRCKRIWTTSPLVDICLKVDDNILELIEDLILGTQFMLNMDATLEKYKIK